ncbi:MAG: tRNA (adenosine(37)-N6)-threonylcarbamoyltransferase complex transferase subunit TsaD [Candidatus Moranbacteria bacterium]|nr:tRNA (adenosine(37)-N6)-threonylcarbamoyltransferase complex transferase subunit TsaD [Candidatus Moranbacteria bacterium]
MNILAIETSCDETAVALVKAEKGRFQVLSDLVSSQVKIHAPFGGVVPNLAAREHLKNLPLLLKKTIRENKLAPKDIDIITVTQGPGLIPALLIGTNSAKALAYAWRVPLVGAHHIAGHIYANFVRENSNNQIPNSKSIKFPVLALIVSGGHTQLILMKKHMDFRIIGETLDDAAGEAFDKVAKILNLGYPGGPIVAAEAEKILTAQKSANPKAQPSDRRRLSLRLPRPMLNSNNLNFSFSGLKTAALYAVKKNPVILKDKKMTTALCAEFQQAVIDVLVAKTLKAAKKYKPKTILLGGGVSANEELRKQLGEAIKNNLKNTLYFMPDTQYSLDNAAMIAVAGYFQYTLAKNKKKFETNWKNLEADAGLAL